MVKAVLACLADKGYDSDKFVRWVEERGGIVVPPSRSNQQRKTMEEFAKKVKEGWWN